MTAETRVHNQAIREVLEAIQALIDRECKEPRLINPRTRVERYREALLTGRYVAMDLIRDRVRLMLRATTETDERTQP